MVYRLIGTITFIQLEAIYILNMLVVIPPNVSHKGIISHPSVWRYLLTDSGRQVFDIVQQLAEDMSRYDPNSSPCLINNITVQNQMCYTLDCHQNGLVSDSPYFVAGFPLSQKRCSRSLCREYTTV